MKYILEDPGRMNSEKQSLAPSIPQEKTNRGAGKYVLENIGETSSNRRKQYPEENIGQWGLRNASALGARAIEGVSNAPYNLVEQANSLSSINSEREKRINKGNENTVDLENYDLNDLKSGKFPRFPGIFETVNKKSGEVLKVLPNGETFKEKVTKPLTGEYLEPRTENEKDIQDIASKGSETLAQIALNPLGKTPSLAQSLFFAFAPEAAAKGAKKAGLGETGQAVARLAPLGGDLVRRLFKVSKLAGKNVDTLYNTARDRVKKFGSQDINHKTGIPIGPTQSAPELVKVNNVLKERLHKGLYKQEQNSVARELHTKLTNNLNKKGKIGISESIDLIPVLNEYKYAKGASNSTKHLVDSVVRPLENVIKDWSTKVDPEVWKLYSQGKEIYRDTAITSTIGQFLKDNVSIRKSLHDPVIKTLLLGGVYAVAGLPATLATIGGSYVTKNIHRAIELFKNSPEIRRLATYAVRDMVNNSAPSAGKHLNQLISETKKEEHTRKKSK
jgi:hypothetical protein